MISPASIVNPRSASCKTKKAISGLRSKPAVGGIMFLKIETVDSYNC